MDDPYKILGISRNATEEQIKDSYRKLARRHHPDKGGNKEDFQKIQDAYERLTSKSNGSTNNSSMNTNEHVFHFMSSFFNKSGNTTTNRKQQLGNEHYKLPVTLDEIYYGNVKKVKISRKAICESCISFCDLCNGEGVQVNSIRNGPFINTIKRTCGKCKGAGKIKLHDNKGEKYHCNRCNNTGIFEDTKIFEILIEKGTTNTRYVISGWGKQSNKPSQISGDFVIELDIKNDTNLKRKGKYDIYTEIPVSFRESIYGKIQELTIFDKRITIDTNKIFGVINPNKEYKIPNCGFVVEQENSGKKIQKIGDLYIKFIVNYPDKLVLSDEEISKIKSVFSKNDM